MQDIHSTGSSAAAGRLFTGEVDKRSRPHHHDLKCPRCQSLNTKFCYYNNYSLSQPRHFCKSCRRYWTKGGVLRNVPVGGRIRKTKRSGKTKSKTNCDISSSDAAAVERKNSENSTRDCSSLTANRTIAETTVPVRPISLAEVSPTNSTPAMLLNFDESSTPFSSSSVTNFDPLLMNQSSVSNISLEIRTGTSMIASSSDHMSMEFTSFQMNRQNQFQWKDTEVKIPEMRSSLITNQRAVIDYAGLKNMKINEVAGKDDRQNSADEGLFDLTGTVDESYWCQSPWSNDDNDHDHDHDHDHLNYLNISELTK